METFIFATYSGTLGDWYTSPGVYSRCRMFWPLLGPNLGWNYEYVAAGQTEQLRVQFTDPEKKNNYV